MRTITRAGILAATLSLALIALPAPATAADGERATERTTSALPSYRTWIADVTAVTVVAQQYIVTRLPDPTVRAAVVLDIDNTALESGYCGWITCPATDPVLEVARQARSRGAAVFFVTARPELLKWITEDNLSDEGYRIAGLYMRPTFDFDSDQVLKTRARADIERRGYRIVANIGNSATDLAGGHAERSFKLPDYDGALS